MTLDKSIKLLYKKWWIKDLLIPILIGLSVFFISRQFDKPKYNIKASICAPLSEVRAEFVNITSGIKHLSKDPNGISPFSVMFENTGIEPLKNVDFYIELIPKSNMLIFYDEYFITKPEKGFGKVDISTESANLKIVTLELFNPSDKFYYYATVNSPINVKVYLKAPGITYFTEKSPGCN